MNTNIEFLKKVISHPEFIRGDVETGFIQVQEISIIYRKITQNFSQS